MIFPVISKLEQCCIYLSMFPRVLCACLCVSVVVFVYVKGFTSVIGAKFSAAEVLLSSIAYQTNLEKIFILNLFEFLH